MNGVPIGEVFLHTDLDVSTVKLIVAGKRNLQLNTESDPGMAVDREGRGTHRKWTRLVSNWKTNALPMYNFFHFIKHNVFASNNEHRVSSFVCYNDLQTNRITNMYSTTILKESEKRICPKRIGSKTCAMRAEITI
jgi:hypothetical protein